ncbi:MAG: nucleotidyltransferase [Bacteroidetes bacterium 46-16]|nr:MAG: nucleotidyltransferase [Bacteroidetes bacterium 46-16]
MATDKTKHLKCVLDSHKIQKEQALLDKHITKKDEIKAALKEEYGSKMYEPFNSGSYAKHTAINTKFDFDLVAPYKRDAFDTLKEMYNAVHDFLHKKYSDEATVKKQKVSIGLEFFADEDGHVVKVDVVPGRELNQDQYKDDNNINLYVHSQLGTIPEGSERLKTNPKAQISNVKDHAEKESVRHDIKLLKIWKVQNGKKPKSFFLELITIKAFDKKDITGDLWDKLKAVLEFIRDEVKTISLPDPGNSNNDVADTLTDVEKSDLSDDMKYMLERIEENSDNIKLYFKVNPDHPCEDKMEENKYNVKREGVSAPPATRFG